MAVPVKGPSFRCREGRYPRWLWPSLPFLRDDRGVASVGPEALSDLTPPTAGSAFSELVQNPPLPGRQAAPCRWVNERALCRTETAR